jgi:uncharacterized protein (DUF433 family)
LGRAIKKAKVNGIEIAVVALSRVRTSILKEQLQAGGSIEHLADDYGCDRLKIESG